MYVRDEDLGGLGEELKGWLVRVEIGYLLF